MPDAVEERKPSKDDPAAEDVPVDQGVEVTAEKKPEPPPDPAPIDDPAVADAMARAREMGITGDPDAPPGYFVDENFRPDPLSLGSIVTTEHAGTSGYDLKAASGLFANAGVHPLSLEENLPESPEPPPAMGATDYQPNLAPGMSSEEAAQAEEQTRLEVAQAKATETAESAQETVQAVEEAQEEQDQGKAASKAQGARKAAPTSPAGTKDTALEADPKK
jgi:hypothetical protein